MIPSSQPSWRDILSCCVLRGGTENLRHCSGERRVPRQPIKQESECREDLRAPVTCEVRLPSETMRTFCIAHGRVLRMLGEMPGIRYIHSGVDGFSIAGDSETIVARAADVIKGVCSAECAPEGDVAEPTLRHSSDVNCAKSFGMTFEDYESRQNTQDLESYSPVITPPYSPVITPLSYESVAPLTHANQEFDINPAYSKETDALRHQAGVLDRCEAGSHMELSSPAVLFTPFPLLLEVISESPSTTPRQTIARQDVRNGNLVLQHSEATEYGRRMGQIAIANKDIRNGL